MLPVLMLELAVAVFYLILEQNSIWSACYLGEGSGAYYRDELQRQESLMLEEILEIVGIFILIFLVVLSLGVFVLAYIIFVKPPAR